jgi:hypothetical protein
MERKGVRKMKRMVLLSLALVVLLIAFPVSAGAKTPTDVAGEMTYMARFKVHNDSGECVPPTGPGDLREPCIRMAGGNTFGETYEEATLTGGMSGSSTADCRVVIHRSGSWFYTSISSFHGTVDGREGSLQISMVGTRPSGEAEWEGSWVILGGDGDLAALHGQGTWSGYGAPGVWVWGTVAYEGQVHFDPD